MDRERTLWWIQRLTGIWILLVLLAIWVTPIDDEVIFLRVTTSFIVTGIGLFLAFMGWLMKYE